MNKITYHLLTARNILNTEEVEKYLKSLVPKVNSKIGKRWINSNLRNYILKKMRAIEVRNYKSSKKDSTQIQKAVEYNETIYKINLDFSFKTEVDHVIDHINGLESLQLKKIIQKPFPILNKQAKEHTKREARKIRKAISKKGVPKDGLRLVKKYGSASLVQLMSWPQFQKETADLDICIGQPESKKTLYDKHLKGKAQYYSLRVQGKAVGTIEVDRSQITQIKGYENGRIDRKYHSIFKNVLNYKVIDYNGFTDKGNTDLQNIDIVGVEGKQYDIYDLPEGLIIKEGINYSKLPVYNLPNNLTIYGLFLKGTPLTDLPYNLIIKGHLDLQNTDIHSLPSSLKVSGEIYVSRNKEQYFKKYENKYTIRYIG
jgi:hypothetical protein